MRGLINYFNGHLICVALICVGTLFFCSGTFVDPETTPKWFWFYVCVFISAIIMAIIRIKSCRFVQVNKLDLIIFGFAVYIIIRVFLRSGIDKENWLSVCSIVLLYLIFRQINVQKNAHLFFAVITIVCFIQAVYGLIQWIGWMPARQGFKVTGSFDNPAGFAACLAISLPCCMYFVKTKNVAIRCFAFLVAFVIIVSIVLSESRAGMLSIVGVIGICFYHYSAWWFTPIKSYVKILFPVLVIALLVGLYFFKKDSADGRLLIWQCTWNIIKDKPILGHGPDGFDAKYMLYQADYFEKHPDSIYEQLAGNVKHPFNEYLLLWCEYGLIGLIFVGSISAFIIRIVQQSDSKEIFITSTSLVALAVFAGFSYPLKYPFVWILICLALALITCEQKEMYKISNYFAFVVYSGIILNACLLLVFGYSRFRIEQKWCSIAHHSLAGKTYKMMPEYQLLYSQINDKPLFLYNYAAELHQIKEYNQSLQILHECERHFNDYDLQMLMAENYFKLKQFNQAENYYQQAVYMCPSRFLPLKNLVEIFELTNQQEKALQLAQKIIDKPVKVPSSTISQIKIKMRQKITAYSYD